ncbi:MAG TPA: MFS transporter [Luteibacter sp.]|jgi:AAHS family 4-hydroxybenzoate transporter-like MFS transporter|nr:MFS transporter [Luteibacter sp.]
MLTEKVVDVSALVESRRLGAGQWWLLALCLIVVTFDGFDAQIMGYTAPALVKAWHVGRGVLGPVISSGLFGLMLGALVLGTLGDRIGRKTIILISAVVFGVGSLLTALATNVEQMTVLRFITGIGLGGAMPGSIALVSEYMPARLRGTMVTITVCGFAIGPAIGGFIAAALTQNHGWGSLFVIGGVVPLLMLPLLWWKLPESSRFLIGRGDSSERIARNLRKVFHDEDLPADATYTHVDGKLSKAPVREIFAEGRAPGTVLLWLAIFLNLVGINLQTSWLPLMITGLGYPIAQAVTATAMLHVGGAIGGLLLSRLLDRFDPLRSAAVIGVLAGVAIILVGFSGGSLGMLKITIFLAGLFVVGGQSVLNALSGMFYPSHIRSTGSGWALGMGRFGAAVGPMVGSALAALNLSMNSLYYVEAIPFFLMGAAIFAIGFTRNQKTYASNRAAALMQSPLAHK